LQPLRSSGTRHVRDDGLRRFLFPSAFLARTAEPVGANRTVHSPLPCYTLRNSCISRNSHKVFGLNHIRKMYSLVGTFFIATAVRRPLRLIVSLKIPVGSVVLIGGCQFLSACRGRVPLPLGEGGRRPGEGLRHPLPEGEGLGCG